MKKISILICFCFIILKINAQENTNPNISPYHDAINAKSGKTLIALNNSPEWQQFLQLYPSWHTSFNEKTNLPHRAFGAPITFASGGNDAVLKAKLFLSTALQAYNLPITELELVRNTNDDKYINVDFVQKHNGMQILWSKATVRFNQNLDIVLFGTDLYNNIQTLPILISPNDAKSIAENAIVATNKNSVVMPNTKIISIQDEGITVYKIVYEVIVNVNDKMNNKGKYQTFIDANNGNIVYRQNKIKTFDVKIKANLYPNNQLAPIQNLPLKNLAITVSGNTYYTNDSGIANIAQTGSIAGTTNLVGKWVNVVNGTNGDTIPNIAISAINTGDSVTLATQTTYPNIAHYNVYYHVNAIHDFMKTKYPTFIGLDSSLPAFVQRTDGTCNAYYDGSSINFYHAGSGCADFDYISDVMYHEYGHGINDKYYTSLGGSFDNGAMGEGYADTWAMSLNHNPIIGQAYDNTVTGNIRQYNAVPKVYPQDIQGEVHADGEIIAGAWWDVGVNWNSVDSMSNLYAATFNALTTGPDGTEGVVYTDILIDALTYDDNDGNLNNGTPHMNIIIAAFARHGITLIGDATMTNHVLNTSLANTLIPVNVDIQASYPMFVGDVKMFYRIKGTTTIDSLILTKNNLNYTGSIANKNAGDIVEYFYQLYDNTSNKALQLPFSSDFSIVSTERNLPNFIMVGYTLNEKYNFDDSTLTPTGFKVGNVTGDNATTGKWIIAKPIGSYSTPGNLSTIVQTNNDHTTGNGNCLITSNANSVNTTVGQADVDNGKTSVYTKNFDISNLQNPAISYWRWFTNSQGNSPRKDAWQVYISYDGGTTWSQYAERTYQPDISWRQNIVMPNKLLGNTCALKFVAMDSVFAGTAGSLVEAAIDDIEIYDLANGTSVKNIDELQTIIYPNPVNSNLQLQINTNGNITYKLINQVGQVLYSNTKNVIQNEVLNINTSTIANSLYYLQIIKGDKYFNKKVMVQH